MPASHYGCKKKLSTPASSASAAGIDTSGDTDNLTSNGGSFVTARITPASSGGAAGIDISGGTDNLTSNGGRFVAARITPASSATAAGIDTSGGTVNLTRIVQPSVRIKNRGRSKDSSFLSEQSFESSEDRRKEGLYFDSDDGIRCRTVSSKDGGYYSSERRSKVDKSKGWCNSYSEESFRSRSVRSKLSRIYSGEKQSC